jgi:hypothetical protein
VQYAIEIVGPTTNTLIPVDVTMLAHADALSLPFIDGFANSIVGFASAGVLLGYANGLATAPSLPDVEAATRYDYKTAREDPPVLDAQTERFNGVVMMAANDVTTSLWSPTCNSPTPLCSEFPRPRRGQPPQIRPSRSMTRHSRITRLSACRWVPPQRLRQNLPPGR